MQRENGEYRDGAGVNRLLGKGGVSSLFKEKKIVLTSTQIAKDSTLEVHWEAQLVFLT